MAAAYRVAWSPVHVTLNYPLVFGIPDTMKTKNLGFTLLELLVTLVIGAVLAALAIPSFERLIDGSRLSTAYNGMVGELTYTRSQAVKRGAPVSICASANGTACNSNNWELGRLVFVDVNGNGDLEPGDTLLKVFGASQEAVTIRTAALTDTGAVVFDARGAVSDTGNLFVCDDRGVTEALGVTLTMIGMSQKAYDTDVTPNGTIDDVDGGEVTCP